MRLAYLCNLYPAVSHSFVRREIAGIEAQGHAVQRFSLRPAPADLRDEADLEEARLVETILGQGLTRLVAAAVALLFQRPGQTVAALAAAMKLSAPGLSQKLRYCAYFLEAAWLARRLQELQVEHLHAHFGTNPAAVALITRAFGGPPFSFTVHGPDEFDAPIALGLGRKIEAATFVAGVSSYGRSQLMRWADTKDWSRLEVIRCGVDSAFLDAEPAGITPNSINFICVARLAPQKGLPLLIEACDRLHFAGERFTVTLIGNGELRGPLEKEISTRGLENVVQLAGVRTAQEIRHELLRARAFVLPSFAEGLPVVLMESLALSRPVIATAIAGIPELVDDQCGWLIPAGSEEALAEAMLQALQASPEELERKGRVGRERVSQMHNSARNAQMILDAIARHG